MVFKIFLQTLFTHNSFAEDLRSQRDIDPRQYNPAKDSLYYNEAESSKSTVEIQRLFFTTYTLH